MCLGKITGKLKNKSGFGWKVFDTDGIGNLLTEFQYNRKVILMERWISEIDYRDYDELENSGINMGRDSYPFGFHIFVRKKDAISWLDSDRSQVVKKVGYRKAHTIGWQMSVESKVIVAKEIKVLE